MKTYQDLLRQVLERGAVKSQRAQLGDATRPKAKSLFGLQVRYDLSEGFPLVTTKRIPFAQVITELLWYLSGSSNNKDLEAANVKVWSQWADPETGELGPVYGKQWRQWSTASRGEFD